MALFYDFITPVHMAASRGRRTLPGTKDRCRKEETMLRLSSSEWSIGYADPWQTPQPPGGVAPLRHDLALARHLEKRMAYGPSTVRPLDISAVTIGVCVRMKNSALAIFQGLRFLTSMWANK